MKTIGITGGTGFIGRHLAPLLVQKGYEVVIFTRNPAKYKAKLHTRYATLDAARKQCDTQALAALDAIVHLAGAGVADKRWTDKRKKEIVESRTVATDFLISQLKLHAPGCKAMVAASATGFYGPDRPGAIPFKEDASPYPDFLGQTCKLWEDASHKAESAMRTTILRFGIVLGMGGGAFQQFERPTRFGIVPILGSGKQMISWIEVNDLAGLIMHCLEHDNVSGIFNAVAPTSVTNRKLMKTIAAVKGGLKIPVPVPSLALKIALGEMSEEVLKSCTASSGKIACSGYVFAHNNIESAVRAILKK